MSLRAGGDANGRMDSRSDIHAGMLCAPVKE